jgi:serine/threonine protein kinase
VASHNLGAPRVIETIVRRCLAKDPAERFPSARELEHALDAAAREVSLHELATTQAMSTPFPSTPPRAAASPSTTAATALPPASLEPRRRPLLALVLVTLVFAGLGFGAPKRCA